MGKNLENLKEVTGKQYELKKKRIDKNIEIVQEAEHKYEEDLKVVEEFVELLAENIKLIKIKIQVGYKPLKFKAEDTETEDTETEYTAKYIKDFREKDGDITFKFEKTFKDLRGNIREGYYIGEINVSTGTFDIWNLKDFVKAINLYKELILEDLAKSAKEYLA